MKYALIAVVVLVIWGQPVMAEKSIWWDQPQGEEIWDVNLDKVSCSEWVAARKGESDNNWEKRGESRVKVGVVIAEIQTLVSDLRLKMWESGYRVFGDAESDFLQGWLAKHCGGNSGQNVGEATTNLLRYIRSTAEPVGN